jgi:hypothetical protein
MPPAVTRRTVKSAIRKVVFKVFIFFPLLFDLIAHGKNPWILPCRLKKQ